MEEKKANQIAKLCIAIAALIVIFVIVAIVMIKYEVEGDKNMPYNLSKIVTVSTAEGIEKQGKNKWNFDVYQNNDLYFYIDKNKDYVGEDTQIEKIRIENIQILEKPQTGEIKTYMPNSTKGRLFDYSEDYLIGDKLEYRGATESDTRTLEIGNQGGNACIRFTNVGLGDYSSDSDDEIVHDGTLLNKLNLDQKQIKFKISFDFVIEIPKHSYKANIQMDLPYGNILKDGKSSIEKTDMSDIIFKREK